jgi:antitoxin component YwqK of YwqJK toxin-antitoxin module
LTIELKVVVFSFRRDGLTTIAAGMMLLAGFILPGCSWREERVTFYTNGQVKERWHEKIIGPNSNVKDGNYEMFYPDGSRQVVGEFNLGDSIGRWQEWYLNGGQEYERTYGELGKPRGRAIVWTRSGDTLDIRHFNDLGELDGRYASFWHETGDLREQGEYKAGKRHGTWLKWYRNGQLEYEREYDRGRYVGKWIDYGRDGQVASSHEYLRDLPSELSAAWVRVLVDGVPTGRSLDFQRRERRVDSIPAEVRVYGQLRKDGQDWIVPFKWSSPRFDVFYKPREETLYVLKHSSAEFSR